MSSESVIFLARTLGPLVASGIAYALWCYVKTTGRSSQHQDALLLMTYIVSRVSLWLLFAIYMQHYVTTSDPVIYKDMLEHFLAAETPIRDFYYPYGPVLMLSMLPFYLLLRHSLAGISLFAIVAEAVALFCFLKCITLLEKRGELDPSWPKQAMAVYLLNPATLYWTVFQGYHSIVQTTYSMAGLYFLLRGSHTIGYAVGLYSLAGAKLIAILDWPALLAVCRPRLGRLLWGTVPLLSTYVAFHIITGDALFPIRYHVGYTGEGNLWYLLTVLPLPHNFYSVSQKMLPVVFLATSFLAGFGYWLKSLRIGASSFSFQAAVGITTFTMSVFFLFSPYTGNYYVPMLMLPASLVVTSPALPHRHGVWVLLLVSGLCITSDAVWTSLGQANALMEVFSAGFRGEQLWTGLLILTIVVRLISFALLAKLGLSIALAPPLHTGARVSVADTAANGLRRAL